MSVAQKKKRKPRTKAQLGDSIKATVKYGDQEVNWDLMAEVFMPGLLEWAAAKEKRAEFQVIQGGGAGPDPGQGSEPKGGD